MWGTLIAAGVSYLGSRSSSKRAKGAEKAQLAATKEELEAMSDMWKRFRSTALPAIQQSWKSYGNLVPLEEAHHKAYLESEQEDRDRYKELYHPVEENVINKWTTIADAAPNSDYVTGRAAAEWDNQAGITAASNERELFRQGVRPDAGRHAGLSTSVALAGGRAAGINDARERERKYVDSRQEAALRALGQQFQAGQPQRELPHVGLSELPNNPNQPGSEGHAQAAGVARDRASSSASSWGQIGGLLGSQLF